MFHDKKRKRKEPRAPKRSKPWAASRSLVVELLAHASTPLQGRRFIPTRRQGDARRPGRGGALLSIRRSKALRAFGLRPEDPKTGARAARGYTLKTKYFEWVVKGWDFVHRNEHVGTCGWSI